MTGNKRVYFLSDFHLGAKYFSDANTRQNFINELKSRRKLDIIKGFTTKGIHRDDFIFSYMEKDIKNFGTQKRDMLSAKVAVQVRSQRQRHYGILLISCNIQAQML